LRAYGGNIQKTVSVSASIATAAFNAEYEGQQTGPLTTRVVYGDHGPYIEFDKHHILLPLYSRFGDALPSLPDPDTSKYYYWLHPKGFPQTKVYWQIKPVTDMPNAPRRVDDKKSDFNRKEGYADYIRGMFYYGRDQSSSKLFKA
jgi:hypothetical protein